MENLDRLARQAYNRHVSIISKELLACGMLLGMMDHVITDDVEVAAVGIIDAGHNSKKMVRYTNPKGWLKYTDSEQIFIDIHEWWHPTLMHFKRQKGRDNLMWNIACDCELNPLITSKYAKPKDALMPEKFGCNAYMTAEEIYEKLKNNPPPELEQLELSEDLVKQMKEAAAKSDHKYGAFEVMYKDRIKNADKLRGAESKMNEEVKALLAANHPMVTKMFGQLPVRLKNIINGYYETDTRYSFEEFANEFGTYYKETSNKRKNKWGLPWGKVNEQSKNLWVAIDTSGSVSNESIKKIIGEIKEIMLTDERNKITVFCIDTEIQSIQAIEDINFDSMKIAGRGGTSFQEIYKVAETLYVPSLKISLEERPDALIYLTDGYATAPNEELVETLWVIVQDHTHSVKPTNQQRKPIEWGKYIYRD